MVAVKPSLLRREGDGPSRPERWLTHVGDDADPTSGASRSEASREWSVFGQIGHGGGYSIGFEDTHGQLRLDQQQYAKLSGVEQEQLKPSPALRQVQVGLHVDFGHAFELHVDNQTACRRCR
jgi:hypothetical protein